MSEEKTTIEPHEGITSAEVPGDPAMLSLADALRVSFRVLTGIMLIFVVLFLATGIASIEQNEKGVIKRFGKVVGLAEPGLAWNWPFPIGEIQRVNTQERRLMIDAFWMHETGRDKLRPLSERQRPKGGLNPARDGYLLTADRNLIHIKFECVYAVTNPVAYISQIADMEMTMKSVLSQAAIAAAAKRTSDAIQADDTDLLRDIRQTAQSKLDAILGDPDAIKIAAIVVPADSKTWPLGAYDAYEAAQRARSQRQIAINAAVAEAKGMTKVIGEKLFIQLVGEPWKINTIPHYDAKYNLIGQLAMREETPFKKGDLIPDRKTLQARIDAILVSSTAGGEVSSIINQAEAQKTRVIQTAERRAQRFEQLYTEYQKAPQVFLEKMWAQTLDRTLSKPTIQKWYVDPGKRGMVLDLKPDPKVLKAIKTHYRTSGEKE